MRGGRMRRNTCKFSVLRCKHTQSGPGQLFYSVWMHQFVQPLTCRGTRGLSPALGGVLFAAVLGSPPISVLKRGVSVSLRQSHHWPHCLCQAPLAVALVLCIEQRSLRPQGQGRGFLGQVPVLSRYLLPVFPGNVSVSWWQRTVLEPGEESGCPGCLLWSRVHCDPLC